MGRAVAQGRDPRARSSNVRFEKFCPSLTFRAWEIAGTKRTNWADSKCPGGYVVMRSGAMVLSRDGRAPVHATICPVPKARSAISRGVLLVGADDYCVGMPFAHPSLYCVAHPQRRALLGSGVVSDGLSILPCPLPRHGKLPPTSERTTCPRVLVPSPSPHFISVHTSCSSCRLA